MDTFLDSLARIFPAQRLLSSAAQLAAYESDALTAYRQRPRAVVIAETQEEVIQAVRLCAQFKVPFMPRGSGTSLSGGSLPVAEGLVISLNRLNRISRIEPLNRSVVVEPGVINLDVSKAVSAYGLYYAPDPSSQQISTIGGNLGFNAGGAHCLKNGVTSNHVLAIKAVLPDGTLTTLGSSSQEGIGPDLAGLFVGSEGLFGIALEITLRLMPKPQNFRTVLAAYDSLEKAGNAVSAVVAAGILPGALEMMDRLAIQAAEAAVHANYPPGAEALLIVELEGERSQVEAEFGRVRQVIEDSGASAVRIAQNDAERLAIWKGRKSAFSAVGRLSPDFLVQDGVVPRSKLGQALAEIEKLGQKYSIRVANVFHAGDGNLHPLVLYNGRVAGEFERAKAVASETTHLCLRLGGSITGEHGVGMEKRAYLADMFSPDDLALMHRLCQQMDPDQLSNRGKVFGEDAPAGPPAQPAAPGYTPEVQERLQALQDTIRSGGSFLPLGARSKPGLANGAAGAAILETAGLSGIVTYDPAEYTISALAGTPVHQVELELNRYGQYLPFDPPLGLRGATLGGCVAAGVNGSGRYRFGGMRDFLLAVRFIDGHGNLVTGGAKVVKNAAGFDLPKLMVGSMGALGVLVELTFKVFPKPEAFRTLCMRFDPAEPGQGLQAAVEVLQRFSANPLDLDSLDLEVAPGKLALWMRIGGLNETIETRGLRLQEFAGGGEFVPTSGEAPFWENVRNFAWSPSGWQLARIALTPTRLLALEQALEEIPALSSSLRWYSSGGQQVWIAFQDGRGALDDLLKRLNLAGQVLIGPSPSVRLGSSDGAEFYRRVKQAIDPLTVFRGV